jgi:hypothetical protein
MMAEYFYKGKKIFSIPYPSVNNFCKSSKMIPKKYGRIEYGQNVAFCDIFLTAGKEKYILRNNFCCSLHVVFF